MRVNVTIPAPPMHDTQWVGLTIEVYARDAVNANYYNSKLVTVWGVQLRFGDRVANFSPTVRFQTVSSPTPFTPHGSNTSVTNVGHVVAHDNEKFSIAPYCDGLLFPLPGRDKKTVYSERSFKALLQLVLGATNQRLGSTNQRAQVLGATNQVLGATNQILGATNQRAQVLGSTNQRLGSTNQRLGPTNQRAQALWAVLYGWMWREDESTEVDPGFLTQMIAWSREAQVSE